MSDIRSALEEAFSKADEAPATTVEATSESVATVEPAEAEKPVVAESQPRNPPTHSRRGMAWPIIFCIGLYRARHSAVQIHDHGRDDYVTVAAS